MPSAAWDERPLPDESAQEGGAEGGAGMELKVELSLPNQPGRALDPAIASKTARGVTRAGAFSLYVPDAADHPSTKGKATSHA